MRYEELSARASGLPARRAFGGVLIVADANSRRKILEADGALDKKLATYEKVNAMWAEAFKAYPGQLVPSVVMGSGAGTTQNSAAGMQQMMELLAAKAAQDLALQSRPAGRGGGN